MRLDSMMARIALNRTNHCRFAIVISKKVLAHAVDRNRARRLIYKIIEENTNLYTGKNLDIAIYLRSYKEEGTAALIGKLLESIH